MKTFMTLKEIELSRDNHLIRQKGISFIELLVVIALVGVMATWGAQSWHHYRQRERLAESARQLLAYLTLLQAQTNRSNGTALLWIQQNERGCLGWGSRSDTACSTLVGHAFISPYPDVAITFSLHKNIGFYGIRNTAQAGHIMLSNPAGRIRLIIWLCWQMLLV